MKDDIGTDIKERHDRQTEAFGSPINGETLKPKAFGARRLISTVLILGGIVLIALPLVGKFLVNREQEAMLEAFYLEIDNQSTEVEAAEVGTQLDEALDWGSQEENQTEISETTQDLQADQLADSSSIKAMGKALGIITIDKIDSKLPIAEGVDLGTLRYAIGHMPGTAGLGEIGNSVLAGHRSHTFNAFFNRLDEVTVGDLIVVENAAGEKTTYEVYEKLFVKPDDLSVLNSTDKYKVLTLITCHPEINPTGRLIVHAVDRSTQTQ